jgi:cytochrome P450
MYGCANRDKAAFDHADSFDLQRTNASKHLAFSQGIHFCPGAPLARLESAIAFEQLFDRLQNFQLDESRSDLRHLPSFTHRSLKKVQIIFGSKIAAVTR